MVYEPVRLTQEYRLFDFMSPWEGADYILPGDEKKGARRGEGSRRAGPHGGAAGAAGRRRDARRPPGAYRGALSAGTRRASGAAQRAARKLTRADGDAVADLPRDAWLARSLRLFVMRDPVARLLVRDQASAATPRSQPGTVAPEAVAARFAAAVEAHDDRDLARSDYGRTIAALEAAVPERGGSTCSTRRCSARRPMTG